MTDEALVRHCADLHARDGLEALSFSALKREGVYFQLYSRGITQNELLSRLGLQEAFVAFNTSRPLIRKGVERQRWRGSTSSRVRNP